MTTDQIHILHLEGAGLTINGKNILAFETTLQALVAALVIQLLITFLRKSEEEFLDESMDYCLRFVVGRLRILAGDQAGG